MPRTFLCGLALVLGLSTGITGLSGLSGISGTQAALLSADVQDIDPMLAMTRPRYEQINHLLSTERASEQVSYQRPVSEFVRFFYWSGFNVLLNDDQVRQERLINDWLARLDPDQDPTRLWLRHASAHEVMDAVHRLRPIHTRASLAQTVKWGLVQDTAMWSRVQYTELQSGEIDFR